MLLGLSGFDKAELLRFLDALRGGVEKAKTGHLVLSSTGRAYHVRSAGDKERKVVRSVYVDDEGLVYLVQLSGDSSKSPEQRRADGDDVGPICLDLADPETFDAVVKAMK